MKQIKKMQANHLYLIQGASGANSSFFENEADCKIFMSLADEHLGDYLSIIGFQNNRDGWVMIIKSKLEDEIRQAYRLRRKRSNKCRPSFEHHEVWRILSDQVRIMLSTYVKRTNAKSGRTGGKVRGNYKRFVFESAEEVEQMKQTLMSLEYDQSQNLKRYRPSKKLFSVKKKRLRKSAYMSCARLTHANVARKLGLRCFLFCDLGHPLRFLHDFQDFRFILRQLQ